MSRNPLLTDLAIAVIAAILILVLTPGVAVAGMIALLVVGAFAVTLVLDARRRRGQAPPRRRPAAASERRPREGVPSTEG